MAISDLLNRRVRAQAKDEDDEVYSEASASASGSEDERDDEGSDQDSEGEDDVDEGSSADMNDAPENNEDDPESDSDDDNNRDDFQNSLNNISFGALAKAQSSLGPKKQKQKHTNQPDDSPETQASPLEDIRARIREAREQKRQAISNTKSHKKTDEQKRTSKHAPMVQSSKHAVTRKRTVIEPPAVPKTRDPRFDPTVVGKNSRMPTASADAAYSFLNDYRAVELKDLKEQLRQTKNAEQKESLKRAVRSATDRMREVENRKREQRILADHKKQEKELIREGKKSNPYYMKKSDLKKQVLLHKYNEMNSKDRAKALERRRKKVAAKERLQMPEERRGLDSGPPPAREGGGKKRKRVA